MQRRRRHGRSERGQSLVEFALVLPMLLVVLFAIVDFGRMFQGYVSLTNATREGARMATTGCGKTDLCTTTEISDRVKATASGLAPTTTVSYPGAKKSGTSVVVQSQATITFITPLAKMMSLIGGSLSGSFTLKSTADMRIE
jgi:Flp pilus assembly protein TadG